MMVTTESFSLTQSHYSSLLTFPVAQPFDIQTICFVSIHDLVKIDDHFCELFSISTMNQAAETLIHKKKRKKATTDIYFICTGKPSNQPQFSVFTVYKAVEA